MNVATERKHQAADINFMLMKMQKHQNLKV